MSHVDEGEMHALLDGAYAHDAPAAARIRDEIATCAECHARFDEAQALRMRASAVLDRAVPRPMAPPFESIVERAGTVEAPRPFRFPAGAPLAWAATIVLALGLGWFGRDWLNNPPPRMASERNSVVRESAAPAGPPAARVESAAAPPPSAPSASAATQRAQQKPPADVPVADAVAPKEAAANQAGARRDDRVAKKAEASGRAANAPRALGFTRDSAAGVRAAEETRQRAAAPPPAAVRTPPTAALSGAVALAEIVHEWQSVSVQEAERITGRRVLLVPGLNVQNVGLRKVGAGYITRTLQSLPDGNVIEIIQEPAPGRLQAERVETSSGAAAQAARDLAKDELGATVIRVTRAEGLLTGRAALPQDSLLALLNRAR